MVYDRTECRHCMRIAARHEAVIDQMDSYHSITTTGLGQRGQESAASVDRLMIGSHHA